MRIDRHLADAAATEAFGAALAGRLRPGDLACLRGGLGAGKTTLARGLISGLMGAPTEVPSPTFTLVQTYETPAGPVWHFDLYRLEADDPHALVELGWEETADAITLVEWPCRAEALMPPHRIDITLEPEGDGRYVELVAKGDDWQDRLNGI